MPDIFAAKEPEEKKPHSLETPPSTHPLRQKPHSDENHIHALSMYCTNPGSVKLHGKDITKDIQLFIRRHIVTNVPWILTALVLLFVPPLLSLFLSLTPNTQSLPGNFLLMFTLLYYLIVFMYIFLSFLSWFYNIIIITTLEIIDIDYSDVVYHDVAATNVNLIEDVQYVQSGFIEGLFNYGDVFVQTAGGKENIEAISIPKPADIARFILSYIGKGRHGG